MCGIYGSVGVGQIDTSVAEAATDRLEHRGPDQRGSWSSGKVFLGMRRLSIIDPATGDQPIWNEDHTCCLIFNGELYNFVDLRPQLEGKGHAFRSRSDTEVVLHAYEQWGPDCLRRFNGMFTIAIWDAPRERLFLARDRIGEKPLYYYQDTARFVFASEIKAILADKTIPRRIHPRGLANFLAFGHAVAPDTIYDGIFKLLPGHYLLVQNGNVKPVEYWDVGDEAQLQANSLLSEHDYAARVLELLDDSVRRRMIADVPVGAFLSGGVDSSAIAALMKKHSTAPVKTFSLGFTLGGAYNELSDARIVAVHLATEHHELHVEHADLVQTVKTLVYHYDEPFGDAASFPLYLLSRFAREHVKVVLSGDGGDELFGGYRRYVADQLSSLYRRFPSVVTGSLAPSLADQLPRFRRRSEERR